MTNPSWYDGSMANDTFRRHILRDIGLPHPRSEERAEAFSYCGQSEQCSGSGKYTMSGTVRRAQVAALELGLDVCISCVTGARRDGDDS